MAKLKKIEQDVKTLSPDELAEFRKWFCDYDAAAWDEQLEQDVRSGKLDQLRQQAVAEHEAHRTREL